MRERLPVISQRLWGAKITVVPARAHMGVITAMISLRDPRAAWAMHPYEEGINAVAGRARIDRLEFAHHLDVLSGQPDLFLRLAQRRLVHICQTASGPVGTGTWTVDGASSTGTFAGARGRGEATIILGTSTVTLSGWLKLVG